MILLDNKLISDDILQNEFVCNLTKCKGACCVKGDAGAPLNKEELNIIKKNLSNILPYIIKEGAEFIEKKGFATSRNNEIETNCMPTGECVFVKYENNIATCGIESANKNANFGFQKPISCHLYPIRVSKVGDYTALNYHKWDICNPACQFGQKKGIKVYEFLEHAITRVFGVDFYEKLASYAQFNSTTDTKKQKKIAEM